MKTLPWNGRTDLTQAPDEWFRQCYDELRMLARQKMTHRTLDSTLEPTALVHETWLRLSGNESQRFASRTHFFAVVCRTMRRILIDTARRQRAVRHGGG